MRKIRTSAARELAAVLGDIAAHSPAGARKVRARIAVLIDHLAEWPETGAAARNRPGMRRTFAVPYSYVNPNTGRSFHIDPNNSFANPQTSTQIDQGHIKDPLINANTHVEKESFMITVEINETEHRVEMYLDDEGIWSFETPTGIPVGGANARTSDDTRLGRKRTR